MRSIVAVALLLSAPAWAQDRPLPQSQDKPVDHGAATPGANQAYQGGGVVLQGAPGAPPPPPSAAAQSQPAPAR